MRHGLTYPRCLEIWGIASSSFSERSLIREVQEIWMGLTSYVVIVDIVCRSWPALIVEVQDILFPYFCRIFRYFMLFDFNTVMKCTVYSALDEWLWNCIRIRLNWIKIDKAVYRHFSDIVIEQKQHYLIGNGHRILWSGYLYTAFHQVSDPISKRFTVHTTD